MRQVLHRYLCRHPANQWKFELRVRYLPRNLEEMCHTERATFFYLYEQIRADYLLQVAWKVDDAVALQLGCIEIRRFFKDMQAHALDRKSNLEFLEHEIGFNKFFPEGLITITKPKTMRKAIQQHFKKYAYYSETECMFKFLDILGQIARYDIEIFKASLGTGWSVPLEVVVGPDLGISYVTDSRCGPSRLADFMHIVDIQTHMLEPESSQKAVVQFRVSGTPQPLVITCPNLRIAESLADLVDGYQMITTQQLSVWSRKDFPTSSSIVQSPPRQRAENTSQRSASPLRVASRRAPNSIDTQISYASVAADDDGDYASPLSRDFRIQRHRVTLEELLGEGQFGDVYRGTFEPETGGVLAVAVKACKIESEETQAENFLEEAYVMQQFHHPHIIKLVGVCFDSPIWIVMELASLGELRSYLLRNKGVLDVATLLLYCQQLSSALSYLDSRKFVHRDIAARNVLVSTHQCVKLSDFGLSRWIEHESFYTASKGKLPIKWMAPESINFRRFTPASDVWMFGVCMWEIVTRGVKPWQGVRNQDVVHKLEAGERLPMPSVDYCPPRLYTLLCQMWIYEPNGRPSIAEVKDVLQEVIDEERHNANDTLRRENRRVTMQQRDANKAMSPAPPKPARHPYPAPITLSTLISTEIPSEERTPSPVNIGVVAKSGSTGGRHVSFSNGIADSPHSSASLQLPLTDAGVSILDEVPDNLSETLEKQRIQSEEDEKWLEEALPNTPCASTTPSSLAAATARSPSPSVQRRPSTSTADGREEQVVYEAVLRVVQAITDLTKRMPNIDVDGLVEMVKVIAAQVKSLLVESGGMLEELPAVEQNAVQLVEKLLLSDMQKISDAMRHALQCWNTTLDNHCRREVLKNAHMLAVDSKNLYQTIDGIKKKLAQSS